MKIEIQAFRRTWTLATKQLPPMHGLSQSGNGWFPWGVIRESFTGAWQTNVELRAQEVLTNPTLFACVTLISGDVAKCCLRLVKEEEDDIWVPTDNPAFSPVLRKPNRYQHIVKFIEQWVTSKLTQGNAYILKQRDNRGVVVAMYVLEPSRVRPLVTQGGDVYYELRKDDLNRLDAEMIVVPASEIIHDRMVCLFHPLIGVTPIYACGQAALQGLTIQQNTNGLFANGSNPGGVLTAPGAISDDTAKRLKDYWDANYTGNNSGKVAVLGDGLKFEAMRQTAVDSQLIEQLNWSDEKICSVYHVPSYMVEVGPPPPYANVEPLLLKYHSQCIQTQFTNIEKCLDEGLGLTDTINGTQYGTEFDELDLIWMDTKTRTDSAKAGIGGGGMSINEARKKYYGLGKVPGGDAVYSQQQNFSIEALAKRDANDPFSKPEPAPPADQPAMQQSDEMMAASLGAALRRKSLERWTRAA